MSNIIIAIIVLVGFLLFPFAIWFGIEIGNKIYDALVSSDENIRTSKQGSKDD